MKSLAEVPSEGQQPTLSQASCEHSSGNTIRPEKNSCKETKGVFCIWCLFAKQWTSLLLKRVWSSLVKNVTPLQVWGRKWQARRGENKRKVLAVYFFPPGTRHVAQLDHRAFQNYPSNQKRNLIIHSFLTVFTGTKEVCPEIATPRSSFYQLRLGPSEVLRERGKPFLSSLKFLMEDTHGRGFTSFYGLLILVLFFPIGQLFR